MKLYEAIELIKDVFEHAFDKDRYTRLIKNLLKNIEEKTFTYQGNIIPNAFENYIRKMERIGKFEDEEGNSIDILIVELRREHSIEYARSAQRNFVRWYLNGSRGGQMKDAALVAFHSEKSSEWRFSLIKMQYSLETKKDEFTPAKRFSFLVGEKGKSHTAQRQLVKLLQSNDIPRLSDLEEAFNIETVTKEFFLKYRGLFLRTKEALDRIVKNDPKIKADFEAMSVDTVNFAKKLMGQIVFLYFLQKKGWFGVGRDDDWGTGSKHFLRELFEGKHDSYDNFFNDILEPLFYEALRSGSDREHIDYYYSRFNCKIPFLNGGLFDPIGNYDWVHTDINLPNDLFSNFRRTKEDDTGDGILDVFDRYNFTVREDEPLEKEVAIDPELLGKAYEKFNAIRPDNFDEFTKALKSGRKGEENKFNKKFGVYYTPREIVHYMCKQSLINYLYTQAEETGLSDTIKKQDIEDLIEVGELITEHEATALIKQEKIKNGIQKSTEYTALLSGSIRENAAAIDKWLEDITVCDPAVGSGAFPVGMMTEIVRARNVLSVFLNADTRNEYGFKRRCIEHSLYGVDIDPGAVEIAKLRLWLSLVVDEENIKNIKPLPNLDYKIVCGNSLLGVEKDLFNLQLFNDLEKLKPLFFKQTNPTKKQEYKKQIDDLISRITDGHREFDFEVYFSEVFRDKIIEKEWSLYHITWVTHNSRDSERMIEFEAIIHQRRINKGLPPIAEPTLLNEEQEILVTRAIAEIVKENEYRVLAYNICKDHVHLALVCEEKERDNIVRQLKGRSAQKYKEAYKIEEEFHLWAQKFSWTLIESEEQLENTVNYIQYNREKHHLPDNKGLQPLVAGMLTPFDHAMKPVVMKGGFDVVIANPPYVKEYVNRSAFDGLRDSPYYQGKMDLWYMFACKGVDVLKHKGILTYIAQNNWVTSYGASKMRNKVIQDTQILSFIDFGAFKIFEAGIQTMVMIFKRNTNSINYAFDYRRLLGNDLEIDDVITILNKNSSSKVEYLTPTIQRDQFLNKPLIFSASDIQTILEKISEKSDFSLDLKKEVAQGIVCPQDYLNKAGRELLGKDFKIGEGIFTLSTSELKALKLSKSEIKLIKPFYSSDELNRWEANPLNCKWIIYTDSSFKDKKKIERFPNVKKHLDQFKNVITSDNKPYGLHRARDEYFFKGEKIISVRKCIRPTFTYVDFDSYVTATFYLIKTGRVNQKYLVGLLNSKLIEYWLKHKGKMQGTNFQIDKEPLVNLPLIQPVEKKQNDVVAIVDKILAITKDLPAPRASRQAGADYLQNPAKQAQVKKYEKQIDQMVYQLYDLTEEEIKIVEGGN